MLFFGLGGLFYVAVLLINAIAILSEDRFLARSTSSRLCIPVPKRVPLHVGWTAGAQEPGFGGQRDDASVKARLINLVSSVRTLMRIPLMFINTLMIVYLLVLG